MSISNIQNLVYGLCDGKLIHISKAGPGLSCGCTCPDCGEKLIARQGRVRAWHFGHVSGAECATAPETALHKLAKQFLLDAGAAIIPDVWVHDGPSDFWRSYSCNHPYYTLQRGEFVKALKMGSEDAFGDVTPDVWIQSQDGRGFFIEIFVTHAVDDAKRVKLRRLGVPTIEADFSGVPRDISPDDFIKSAVKAFDEAYWVYHPLLDKWNSSSNAVKRSMLKSYRDRLLFDAKCPECGGHLVPHLLCGDLYDDDDDVTYWACDLCGRVHYVSCSEAKFVYIFESDRLCPECGEWMTLRHGRYGEFWGCDNYPFCKKTIPGWR